MKTLAKWTHRLSVAATALAFCLALCGCAFDGAAGFGYGPFSIGALAMASLPLSWLGALRDGRRWLRAAGVVLVLIAGVTLLVVFPPKWLLASLNSPQAPLFVLTQRRVVALSIDDSLDAETTPRLLSVLEEHNARATFFVLSDTVVDNQALLTDLVAAGHEIGNHQTHDTRGWQMSPDAFAEDIRLADETLSAYAKVRWLRPGGGYSTGQMLQAAERQGQQVMLGSVFPLDSHIPSTTFAANYVESRVFPGAIIVLHDVGDRGRRTADVLERVLPRLRAKGYRVVPVGELVNRDQP